MSEQAKTQETDEEDEILMPDKEKLTQDTTQSEIMPKELEVSSAQSTKVDNTSQTIETPSVSMEIQAPGTLSGKSTELQSMEEYSEMIASESDTSKFLQAIYPEYSIQGDSDTTSDSVETIDSPDSSPGEILSAFPIYTQFINVADTNEEEFFDTETGSDPSVEILEAEQSPSTEIEKLEHDDLKLQEATDDETDLKSKDTQLENLDSVKDENLSTVPEIEATTDQEQVPQKQKYYIILEETEEEIKELIKDKKLKQDTTKTPFNSPTQSPLKSGLGEGSIDTIKKMKPEDKMTTELQPSKLNVQIEFDMSSLKTIAEERESEMDLLEKIILQEEEELLGKNEFSPHFLEENKSEEMLRDLETKHVFYSPPEFIGQEISAILLFKSTHIKWYWVPCNAKSLTYLGAYKTFNIPESIKIEDESDSESHTSQETIICVKSKKEDSDTEGSDNTVIEEPKEESSVVKTTQDIKICEKAQALDTPIYAVTYSDALNEPSTATEQSTGLVQKTSELVEALSKLIEKTSEIVQSYPQLIKKSKKKEDNLTEKSESEENFSELNKVSCELEGISEFIQTPDPKEKHSELAKKSPEIVEKSLEPYDGVGIASTSSETPSKVVEESLKLIETPIKLDEKTTKLFDAPPDLIMKFAQLVETSSKQKSTIDKSTETDEELTSLSQNTLDLEDEIIDAVIALSLQEHLSKQKHYLSDDPIPGPSGLSSKKQSLDVILPVRPGIQQHFTRLSDFDTSNMDYKKQMKTDTAKKNAEETPKTTEELKEAEQEAEAKIKKKISDWETGSLTLDQFTHAFYELCKKDEERYNNSYVNSPYRLSTIIEENESVSSQSPRSEHTPSSPSIHAEVNEIETDYSYSIKKIADRYISEAKDLQDWSRNEFYMSGYFPLYTTAEGSEAGSNSKEDSDSDDEKDNAEKYVPVFGGEHLNDFNQQELKKIPIGKTGFRFKQLIKVNGIVMFDCECNFELLPRRYKKKYENPENLLLEFNHLVVPHENVLYFSLHCCYFTMQETKLIQQKTNGQNYVSPEYLDYLIKKYRSMFYKLESETPADQMISPTVIDKKDNKNQPRRPLEFEDLFGRKKNIHLPSISRSCEREQEMQELRAFSARNITGSREMVSASVPQQRPPSRSRESLVQRGDNFPQKPIPVVSLKEIDESYLLVPASSNKKSFIQHGIRTDCKRTIPTIMIKDDEEVFQYRPRTPKSDANRRFRARHDLHSDAELIPKLQHEVRFGHSSSTDLQEQGTSSQLENIEKLEHDDDLDELQISVEERILLLLEEGNLYPERPGTPECDTEPKDSLPKKSDSA